MQTLQKTALIFTIIGALNWGFIGIFDFNLVEAVFGEASVLSRVIYSLVGITGLINIGMDRSSTILPISNRIRNRI